MKIISFDAFLDGGTFNVNTDKGDYYFDHRIKTTTAGKLYLGYPRHDNSNIINNSDELEREIIDVLKTYKAGFYQQTVDNIIQKYEKL
jgi:hypothetical protein